ncbi:MAG TPA: class I SAM-dependent methyltransferase [Gaiellaceae bacterium]|nr:class I SAM-dependent methyltransferase [Gaiellaceae bacterium]
MDDVAAFYDGFGESCHLVYGDDWDGAAERHAAALDRLIRTARPAARDLLDCSCGIGLARLGYRVTGTDLSERAVEAARPAAEVDFAVCDFRDLDGIGGAFDVVLSYDNAVPHLLEDAEVERALASMRRRLRPGGLLLVGIRDYDAAVADQCAIAAPSLVEGPLRRLVARLHDWDAPGGPLHTVDFFVLTEEAAGWTFDRHHVRYRALTREALARAAGAAGLRDVRWTMPGESGLGQPVTTACA